MTNNPPCVFFDLGQTLVTEWNFINHFDGEFLELLNGYGARIDLRNYHAIRDDIIRNRRIGYGSIRELVIEVCRAVLPNGYENVILQRLDSKVKQGKKELFRLAGGTEKVIKELSDRKCDLGIIANQSNDILALLQAAGLDKYFKVIAISGTVKIKKPDPGIFHLALKEAKRKPEECVMVGDRLDTDICPANRLGMTTIRVTDSLFALQQPREECEYPAFTVFKLIEVLKAVENIISGK